MTTIAAVRLDDAIVVACDTRATDNTGRIWPVRTKLLELGDPGDVTVIGHSGHRMIRHALEALGAPAWATCDTRDRAVRVWVEQLAAMLRERSVPACEDGLIDGAQLVAHADDLYYCTDGLAEPLAGPIAAIGSGGDLALGYLEACLESGRLRDVLTAGHCLTLALHAAARSDSGTGPEVRLVELADGRATDPDHRDAPTDGDAPSP